MGIFGSPLCGCVGWLAAVGVLGYGGFQIFMVTMMGTYIGNLEKYASNLEQGKPLKCSMTIDPTPKLFGRACTVSIVGVDETETGSSTTVLSAAYRPAQTVTTGESCKTLSELHRKKGEEKKTYIHILNLT